jgi:hypothetical protein
MRRIALSTAFIALLLLLPVPRLVMADPGGAARSLIRAGMPADGYHRSGIIKRSRTASGMAATQHAGMLRGGGGAANVQAAISPNPAPAIASSSVSSGGRGGGGGGGGGSSSPAPSAVIGPGGSPGGGGGGNSGGGNVLGEVGQVLLGSGN